MSLSLFDLTGRVAVVMGGTSGLGRSIALALAEAGANVVATGRREANVLEVANEIERRGRKTLRKTADAAEQSSIDALRDEVGNIFGRVDILVNSAGKIARKPVLSFTEEEWNGTFDVNLNGTLRACRGFCDLLAESRHGRIINIASLNSYVSFLEVAAYAASKAAVLGLTRSLAVEWASKGINVNAIAPGVFRTELNAGLLDGTPRGQELRMRTPSRRFGTLEEINGAALLLASDASSFITGQCIVVDGGFLASGVNQ